MLKQNTTIFAQYPVRRFGGALCQEAPLFYQHGAKRNWYASANTSRDLKSGHPTGTLNPGAALFPQKSGGMASRNVIAGAGTTAFAITGGVNGEATIVGSGDITSATAQLVISMVATLAGSGTVADADLRGYLNAVATLTGSGDITAAIAALGWLGAATSGSGTISSATPYATGTLAATIRGYSDLTPEGLRDLVWNATAASYTTSGTMGQKVNSAASGGVDLNALAAAVWQYVIENGLTAENVLRIYGAVLSGKVSGAGTGTEVFTGLDGTTVRVTSTVDGDGNRTTVVVDGA